MNAYTAKVILEVYVSKQLKSNCGKKITYLHKALLIDTKLRKRLLNLIVDHCASPKEIKYAYFIRRVTLN